VIHAKKHTFITFDEVIFLMSRQARLALAAILLLLSLASFQGAFARVNQTWDWTKVAGNEKTKIIYCFEDVGAKDGLPGGRTWKGIVSDAALVWNRADTGWTFEVSNMGTADEGKVTKDCQLQVNINDHNIPGGAFTTYVVPGGREDCTVQGVKLPADGRISKRILCIDPTPNRFDNGKDTTWNTAGADTFDPVLVVAHELGHVLRLAHPTNAFSNNITDPINIGVHAADLNKLSDDDKKEAKASVDRTKTPIMKVGFNGNKCDTPFPIFDPGGALASDFRVSTAVPDTGSCRPLFDDTVPFRFNVPTGACPVELAIEVDADVQSVPATISISYYDQLLADPEYFRGVVSDPTTFRGFFFSGDALNSGQWLPVTSATSVDTSSKIVTFQTDTLSPVFFGIAGQCAGAIGIPEFPLSLLVITAVALLSVAVIRVRQDKRTVPSRGPTHG
jgi:hypothetical protein